MPVEGCFELKQDYLQGFFLSLSYYFLSIEKFPQMKSWNGMCIICETVDEEMRHQLACTTCCYNINIKSL